MKPTLLMLRNLCLVFAFASPGISAELFHLDTFDGSTSPLGWTGSSVSVQQDSGAGGAGDNSLRVVARGGNGPGSNLATHNDTAAWRGNYLTDGVTAIQADFFSPTANSVPLQMRLVLFSGTTNRWLSSDPFVVPNDGGWHTATFPVGETDLTRVLGNIGYDSLITNVTSVMFRHNTSLSSGGTPVNATINIDNILLLGLQEVFPDANGDGIADGMDFNIWNANRNRTGTDLATGDFNQDQITDHRDLDIWMAHRFTTNPDLQPASSVPEPAGAGLFWAATTLLASGCARRTRSGRL